MQIKTEARKRGGAVWVAVCATLVMTTVEGNTTDEVLNLSAMDDALIGYYDFEEGFDNSITPGGLPDGTAVNSPEVGTSRGRVGNAMLTQGADNDHMNLVASFGTGATLGTEFSISAWYRLNNPIISANGSGRYFVYESSNDYDVSYGLRNLSLGVAGVNDGQAYTQTGFMNVSDAGVDGWHHVIQTYTSSNGTTTIGTVVDGWSIDPLALPTADFSGNGFNFGAPRSTTTDRGFDGLIDEAAIWDRVLTGSEMAIVHALGMHGQPLVSTNTPAPAPSIVSFTATPAGVMVGGTSTLSWAVSGADFVTINEGIGDVTATNSQLMTIDSARIYTLVAIKDETAVSSQVHISISGPSDHVGPYVGTLKTTEAYLLYSPGQDEIDLRLTVMTDAGATVTSVDSSTFATNDYVAKFHATGLTEGTAYRYKIEKLEVGGGTILYAGDDDDHYFTTVASNRANRVVKAAFVSGVHDSTDSVWLEMASHDLDLLCLGGDTPYIDTAVLSTIRSKYRHMMQRPGLMDLGRNISVVGTWDDHDFGLNNGNGVTCADRKVNTRRGFVEYRAHDRYGASDEGIYHKVDMGAMEIFLLDPRWWSQTAASPVDASQSTCFGSVQWQWILDSIRNSDAPFKVLLQGQIWQDKKSGETDDMFTYWSERDAMLDMIKQEKIPGVVLIGGDIHLSRYLLHPQRVGYDLHDFITCPGHESTILSLNVYHPSLEWSLVEPHQFLTLKADTTKSVPELTAQYIDQTGAVRHELVIPYDELSFRDGTGLGRDLRALWTFDEDAKNQSILGARLDGTLVNGATRSDTGGARGGAVTFSRAAQQYLTVPRSFLDDNAKDYTVSVWCKADSLPVHGGVDRSFIMETMVNNHVGLPDASTSGFGISIGFQATTETNKVNLQLFTETLDPTGVGSLAAPRSMSQGGFNFDVDRSLFDAWTQIAVTFNSQKLRLYVNGAFAIEHVLPTAGPIAETGGLVIGGHRSGTGRNFDGSIDEVAVWQRVLDDAEVSDLYNAGTPPQIPVGVFQADTDGDSLPDWWEGLHGLVADLASDATSDVDGDGLTAREEFALGTLPEVRNAWNPYRQTFIEVEGQQYQGIIYQRSPAAMDYLKFAVERSTNLLDGSGWVASDVIVDGSTRLPTGLDEVTERSLMVVPSENAEFLRLRLEDRE